ncbi:ATP-dependent DNA helicase Q4 [Pseudolycoriella hygida]|uniref:DNA 3'-5' helicase n=1 Tax=Pseudolycoriella hygida TaxID=35572 RepID=A0A9Q0N369_9DIPT|nr:ATP-dependent DNA helicase Q4 [Pseudolycoriella hygida]
MEKPEQNKYIKYRKCVKLWETNFKEKHGRIPSKHDIREADLSIRQAYKMYYRYKSSFLENTLSQVIDEDGYDLPADSDQSLQLDANFSLSFLDTSDDSSSFLSSFPNSDDMHSSSMVKTRNVDGNDISEDFEPAVVNAINQNAWGSHLNKKQENSRLRQIEPSNSQSFRQTMTEKLFPLSNFAKRNPRKSFSRSNLQPNSLASSNTTKEILPDLETILAQKAIQEKTKCPIKAPKPCNLTLDKGWLNRCDESGSRTSIATKIPTEPSDNRYGLSNIKTAHVYAKCTYDNNDLSYEEIIENSEDESDRKTRNVRHVLKKRKVLNVHRTNGDNRRTEVPLEQLSGSVDSDKIAELKQEKSESAKKMKPAKNVKVELTKLQSKETPSETLRRSYRIASSTKNKPLNAESKSESDPFVDDFQSDTEFQPVEKTFHPESNTTFPTKQKNSHKKGNNQTIRTGKKISDVLPDNIIALDDMPDDYIPQIEAENLRNVPQIDIDQLKADTALFQDYVKHTGPNITSSHPKVALTPTKRDIEREKLEKKVAAGKLNENFVRIDVRKKVFVRGKKTINFSKYKKSKWKKQKTANALAGPEIDMRGCDGGFLVCFNCGQQGHFAQDCKIQSDKLLPLDVDVEEETTYQTLEEAANVAAQPDGSDNEMDEEMPSSSHDSYNFEPLNSIATHKDTQNYIGHAIPQDILIRSGLLDTPNSKSESAEPLYKTKSDGSVIDPPKAVYDALKLFGHTTFRKGQDKAIMRVLSGLSTLVTLSTGSGKSLCYQLPAFLYRKQRKCITLVISPLVSLMEDQVRDVPHFLTAECLHSNQPKVKQDKIIQRIKQGTVDVLLISPEAIVAGEKSTGFGALLRDLPPIAFVCIDEAHCISQWSHNFRPSYLMICRVIQEKFKVNTVLGLTATATIKIRESIVDHLRILDGLDGVITDVPLPDNLLLTVSKDRNRDEELIALLRSDEFMNSHSIIIYCSRRDECNRVADYIRTCMQDLQVNIETSNSSASRKRKRPKQIVESYHAGLPASRRRTIQNLFMSGALKIVVATIAFGMGINKSDIRAVIHYNMPMTFESYVQEVGRAGRDGLPAHCHLFLEPNGKDKIELKRHIYANSVDRHVIRKLLKKVFVQCACQQNLNKHDFQSEIDAVNSMIWTNDFNADLEKLPLKESKCCGHEVGIPIDDTIQMLDIPEESIETLLNYLQLDQHNYVKVLGKAYCSCKVISYGGPKCLKQAAQNCAPLAMSIALELKKGISYSESSSSIEFDVIEVASAIGWDSGVVKYQLKNLEWTTVNGTQRKSSISVQFNNLGFRIRSRGDLTNDELDSILNNLYSRVVLQEKSQLAQLKNVFDGLSSVAYRTFNESQMDDDNHKSSNKLKLLIREYFQSTENTFSLQNDELIDDGAPVDQIIKDVQTMIALYPENNFTGRNIARIFHGVPSPVYPAQIWSRCKFWRGHVTTDFNIIVKLANSTIVKMRTQIA